MTIWYDILFAVNTVSKNLQKQDMQINVAINQLKDLTSFFETYREHGYVSAIVSAKEIPSEMGIEPKFQEKRVIRRKPIFGENNNEERILSHEDSFRIDYFIYIVDQAISSIKIRFQQFELYESIFGFLFSFEKLKSLDDDSLKNSCMHLEKSLKHDMFSNIDGLYLFSELKVLKEVLQFKINTPLDILNYIKKIGSFPNAFVAYRILLTMHVTVASAERSFSKLKLIKSFLRSTMSQERLNGLAMLSIEKDFLGHLNFEDLINNFASKKARRIIFN
ncbi:TTF-type domain-containing protein [Citrus sinensis]|uniref:TTF-type domain-containing protein n=1 Tax=Citrus sinensis TaxID=2711 RepID=A0ACB8JML3_CITSI|nr:TTF-type domain-containing protein [Citrus sinensis]